VLTVRPVAAGLFEKLGINPAVRGPRGSRPVSSTRAARRPPTSSGAGAPDPARLRTSSGRVVPRTEIEPTELEEHRQAGGLDRGGGAGDRVSGRDRRFPRGPAQGLPNSAGSGAKRPGVLVKISGPRTGRRSRDPVEAARDAVGEMGRALRVSPGQGLGAGARTRSPND
jgi:hypothetical protein